MMMMWMEVGCEGGMGFSNNSGSSSLSAQTLLFILQRYIYGFCLSLSRFLVRACAGMNDNANSLESNHIWLHHKYEMLDHQTSSIVVKRISAPVSDVWSLVRRFDEPQKYKPFVQSCTMRGDVQVGSVREVCVISGLPATTSTEILETLDDEEHILSYRILGGEHRLQNYKSTITLHPECIDGKSGTLAVESYVVDVPEGNTKEETRFFVEALLKCNLKSLADVCEQST